MSSAEMVERVTRAICREYDGEENWVLPHRQAWGRAAIQAMYDYQADHRWTEVDQDADWWVGPPADVAP
jgi:hypothetical protein